VAMPLWEVSGTNEFADWYGDLNIDDQAAVDFSVGVLEEGGPSLGRPDVDRVENSKFPNMKELRAQSGGKPLRIFFAFDANREAILLIGGDKTGDNRFYKRMIPQADSLYQRHLDDLEHDDG
jgi:hypothetical protein